jgi:hypothetical protein
VLASTILVLSVMVLLVSVLVVSCPTRVVVAERNVIVPVFEIVDITGAVKVLFVSVCAVAAPTI